MSALSIIFPHFDYFCARVVKQERFLIASVIDIIPTLTQLMEWAAASNHLLALLQRKDGQISKADLSSLPSDLDVSTVPITNFPSRSGIASLVIQAREKTQPLWDAHLQWAKQDFYQDDEPFEIFGIPACPWGLGQMFSNEVAKIQREHRLLPTEFLHVSHSLHDALTRCIKTLPLTVLPASKDYDPQTVVTFFDRPEVRAVCRQIGLSDLSPVSLINLQKLWHSEGVLKKLLPEFCDTPVTTTSFWQIGVNNWESEAIDIVKKRDTALRYVEEAERRLGRVEFLKQAMEAFAMTQVIQKTVLQNVL